MKRRERRDGPPAAESNWLEDGGWGERWGATDSVGTGLTPKMMMECSCKMIRSDVCSTWSESLWRASACGCGRAASTGDGMSWAPDAESSHCDLLRHALEKLNDINERISGLSIRKLQIQLDMADNIDQSCERCYGQSYSLLT